jgi:hypothetical protein
MPFLLAKVWSSFLVKFRCGGSSTPTSNRAYQ